ncbi:AT-rich interactive domain-containing protein 3A-like [Crotalus adamanteus]|uniref:AT-rich interactive domain-containing protein 3 n=1 Tax=Crotalus adamanteus TaxID=8729 RepID=A0AAW1C3H0_CROAD
MAKQVLDLYTLYWLVTEKGGLVEVINKKIWREITKGLNLPTSITSAAFTLRTQYMKYLYPYECEKRGLSSPGELQAAIDSNRREGRRQMFGATLFSYSPTGTPGTLASPKVPLPALALATHNGSQIGQAHAVKKEESLLSPGVPSRIAIPVSLAGHHLVAAQAAASQAAALEQLREKLETSEPPEKKMALVAEEQQRLVQQALQQNLLAMASQFPVNIKVNSRGDDRQETALNLSTNSISSINMSIEINGVVYTGVLFARRSGLLGTAGGAHSHSSTGMPPSQLLSATVGRGGPPELWRGLERDFGAGRMADVPSWERRGAPGLWDLGTQPTAGDAAMECAEQLRQLQPIHPVAQLETIMCLTKDNGLRRASLAQPPAVFKYWWSDLWAQPRDDARLHQRDRWQTRLWR